MTPPGLLPTPPNPRKRLLQRHPVAPVELSSTRPPHREDETLRGHGPRATGLAPLLARVSAGGGAARSPAHDPAHGPAHTCPGESLLEQPHHRPVTGLWDKAGGPPVCSAGGATVPVRMQLGSLCGLGLVVAGGTVWGWTARSVFLVKWTAKQALAGARGGSPACPPSSWVAGGQGRAAESRRLGPMRPSVCEWVGRWRNLGFTPLRGGPPDGPRLFLARALGARGPPPRPAAAAEVAGTRAGLSRPRAPHPTVVTGRGLLRMQMSRETPDRPFLCTRQTDSDKGTFVITRATLVDADF